MKIKFLRLEVQDGILPLHIILGIKKARQLYAIGLSQFNLDNDLLSHGKPHTTIGDDTFHF